MSGPARRRRRGIVALAAVLLGACAGPPPEPSTTAANPTTTSRPPSSRPGAPTVPPGPANSAVPATTDPGSRGLLATDRLEDQHRLAQALPHSTPHYRIEFSVGSDGRLQLRVTLLAVLNSRRDLAAYQAQLRQYKAEALEFIQAQGDDPATYTVTWLPPEAAGL